MKRYIAEALEEYLDQGNHPWHMPGHKRVAEDAENVDTDNSCSGKVKEKKQQKKSLVDAALSAAKKMDVTEVPGTDDLHLPETFIKASMEELKRIYGTFASYYLVNGSTSGIMSAIAAATKINAERRKIIIARNCHKSVYNAIWLLGLEPIYVEVQEKVLSDIRDEAITVENAASVELNTPHIEWGVSVEAVKKVLEKNVLEEICAMVLSSPNYNGILSDIAGIKKLLQPYGIKLIVDEAHGAHLPFMSAKDLPQVKFDGGEFPESAISCGADIVVQSLHKTLPALTQTAILHVIDEELDEYVRKYIYVFMSSSPSYVLLASMEQAIAEMEKRKHFQEYIESLTWFYEKANKLTHIHILTKEQLAKRPEMLTISCDAFDYDRTRIVLWADEFTGEKLSGKLAEQGKIVCEMSGIDYVVLISTACDSRKEFEHLLDTLQKIDKEIEEYPEAFYKEKKLKQNHMLQEETANQDKTVNKDETVIYKEDAEDLVRRIKALENTVAKDNIYVYPPGSYIVRQGDVVSLSQVLVLCQYARAGKRIRGI